MKNLIRNTIEKIKKQHLAPEPKWKYLIRKYGVWALFVLVVIFGASSLSAAYYVLTSLDWDLYRFMHQNLFSYSVSIFPYFWAILIGIFMIAAFFDIRRTETGYRFSLLKILLITVGSIIVIGMVMSLLGVGLRVSTMMTDRVPFYGQHMMVTKETQWNNPAEGFLSGTIVSISGNFLALKDLQGKTWNIKLDEETLIRPRANISEGQMIKIIGKQLDDDNFQSIEIRPWTGMGRGMMGGNVRSGNMMNNGAGRGGMMRGN